VHLTRAGVEADLADHAPRRAAHERRARADHGWLVVRPFVLDDRGVHTLLDRELADANVGTEGSVGRAERRRWLEWTVLGYQQLAYLRQPPYGDRAIVLRATDELVGACGYVPCLMPFGQLPGLAPLGGQPTAGRRSTEFGLFWAIAPAHRRQGYATEAASTLIDYAFTDSWPARIVAPPTTTTSPIGVMQVGYLERNPPHAAWLQVVGILSADQPSLLIPI
jgi:RimJ/RimL family protein N-acetyltransferase